MMARAYVRAQQPQGHWLILHDEADYRRPAPWPMEVKLDPAWKEEWKEQFKANLRSGLHGPEHPEMEPAELLCFFGRLRQDLKTDEFRDCEEKAYRWVIENSAKTFFWRDQGHHSMCLVVPVKQTGRGASYFAQYLLNYAPKERCDLALVADLMRFSETRHLDWSRPKADSAVMTPSLVDANHRESGASIWMGSRFALVWEQLAQRTGERLHREKARAIMDAITHNQDARTGSVESSMNLGGGFDRFGLNLSECAKNLLAFEELRGGPEAKTAPPGQDGKTKNGEGTRP